jgi:hypothetical protein
MIGTGVLGIMMYRRGVELRLSERQQQFKVKPEGRPSSPNDINRGLHASETRLEGKFPAARAHCEENTEQNQPATSFIFLRLRGPMSWGDSHDVHG